MLAPVSGASRTATRKIPANKRLVDSEEERQALPIFYEPLFGYSEQGLKASHDVQRSTVNLKG